MVPRPLDEGPHHHVRAVSRRGGNHAGVRETVELTDTTDAGILRRFFTDTMRGGGIVTGMRHAKQTDDEGPALDKAWNCRFAGCDDARYESALPDISLSRTLAPVFRD